MRMRPRALPASGTHNRTLRPLAQVVYDITSEESLQVAKKWVSELRQKGSPGMVIALAGNKLDMVSLYLRPPPERCRCKLQRPSSHCFVSAGHQAVKRSVQTEDVQAYATEQGLLFNEISAKQDIGVRSHHMTRQPPSPCRWHPARL